MATHTIICAACGTSVGAHQNPQPNDVVRCRKCGQSDTYATIIAAAQRFVMDHANSAGDGAEPPAETPERKYRWVVEGFGGWRRDAK
jgi:hypothetical protein